MVYDIKIKTINPLSFFLSKYIEYDYSGIFSNSSFLLTKLKLTLLIVLPRKSVCVYGILIGG